tara:strand:- start:55 stop:384 length:330 start_codon:yes stop_codon:yes gene_type:complete
MNTLTLILSIEIGMILGLAIASIVNDIRISNRNKRIAKLQMEIAVNEGILQAFQNIKLEQEYRDYINGDSGERYTEEELMDLEEQQLENYLDTMVDNQIENLLLEKGEK